jgi:hypothetical protein
LARDPDILGRRVGSCAYNSCEKLRALEVKFIST